MRKGNTKEKLIKAGFFEFSRYGYFGANMERIAKKARVNKAMIFYYFGSKKGFYLELLQQIFIDLKAELKDKLSNAKTQEELVKFIVESYFKLFQKNSEYVKLFISVHL
jgi:AcrR family transcriptional regulator